MLECALSYAGQGFSVFPCRPRGKEPITANGFLNATTDTAVITKWWTDSPSANIGMPMGGAKRLLAVDIDPRNGNEESLEQLIAKYGPFPKTAEQLTGGGGRHLIFAYNGGPVPKQLAQGVDLKGDGGYILVAPSVHPSGRRYQWDGLEGAKALLHPAEVPACYLALTPNSNGTPHVFAEKIPKGGQHHALVSLAGSMRNRGCDFEEIFAALKVFNEKRCTEPGPEKNIRQIAESICRKAPGKVYEKPAKPIRPAPAGRSLKQVMSDSSVQTPDQVIAGMLPRRGLGLLGGRPKDGKTWLACQIALSIVSGQALGGWLKVNRETDEQLRVALWALEDQEALTKDKMAKLLQGAKIPDEAIDRVQLYAELPHAILDGGDDDIRAALRKHPVDVIILDSLFKLSGASRPNSDISQRDYQTIDKLRKIALEFNCLVLVVMHTKKGAPGGNPIENLLGTTGIPAAADVIIELKRHKSHAGKLTVVGRSVQSDSYELEWHGGPDKWGWGIRDQGGAWDGETGEEILAYLDAQGDSRPNVIAAALKKSFGGVWQALLLLRDKGKVTRMPDKRWTLRKS